MRTGLDAAALGGAAGQVTVVLAVPVMVGLSVSVAVIDCDPAAKSVKPLVNVCVPASPPLKV